jgi:N-acylneuraminate cytidylyltransferase
MTTQIGLFSKKNKKLVSIFCLIPARSGSKRIKNKNIKFFHGKPIISYAILNAKKSGLFDKVFVSTDSPKIAAIAKKFGAEIPFLRPKNISDEKTIDDTVKNHFLEYCKERFQIKYLCYLYPCTPLLEINTLKKSFQLMVKKKYEKLFTICKYSSHIQRALEKNSNNEIKYKNVNYQYSRSQKLKEYYYDAGQFYWYNYNKNIIKKTIGYELSKFEGIDINTIEDFNLASKIFRKIW